ncbi:hypothetical protein Ancab_008113 [Ancistrocladus abbreviatus]
MIQAVVNDHVFKVRAEEVWAIGQALGASFVGDEQELLLRIDDMEAQDRVDGKPGSKRRRRVFKFAVQFMGLVKGNTDIPKGWKVVWLAGIWVIWHTHNLAIFQNKISSCSVAFDWIRVKTFNWLVARGGFGDLPSITSAPILDSPTEIFIPSTMKKMPIR